MERRSEAPVLRELKTGVKVTSHLIGETAKPVAKIIFREFMRSMNNKMNGSGRRIR